MNDNIEHHRRIYILTARMHDGGTATITYNYYKMFKNNGVDVKIVTLEKLPLSAKFNNVEQDLISLDLFDLCKGVMSFRMLKSMIVNTPRIMSFLRNCNGGVIFIHFLPILLGVMSWPFRKKNNKYIFTIHTDVFSYKKKVSVVKRIIFTFFERALQLCDCLVFITPDVTNKYRKMYPKTSKAITIPNVFYGENILSSANYDTRDPTRFILYSGRLSSEKNIDFIIDSYVEYRRMGGGEN
ncbi:glycosyltransferase [Vibrio metschnikovii]|uniref:glycosyltransferase n=1 Tax=Vibrio metschnikovii TaxID=28172 RepID=UPI001302DB92|nr:glycosyltransferase [Vibrio metschnikovii]